MLRLKNLNEQQGAALHCDQEFKWQCGPSLSRLRRLPNLEITDRKTKASGQRDTGDIKNDPPTAQGKAFLNAVDQKTVDFEEYYNMDMAGKGTGYDAYGKAIEYAKELKQKHDASIVHLTDSGFEQSLHRRLLKAILSRDGVDIDDTRDKFTIKKEAQESKKMIRDCYREDRMNRRREEQSNPIQIDKKSKEKIYKKQVSSQHILSELFKGGVEKRDERQQDKVVQIVSTTQKLAQERVYTKMRTHWSEASATVKAEAKKPDCIVPAPPGRPAYMNLLNYQAKNLMKQSKFKSNCPDHLMEKTGPALQDTLNASQVHQRTLISLNELHSKCDKACPQERRLRLGSQSATFGPRKRPGQYIGSYKAFRKEIRTLTRTQRKVDQLYKIVKETIEDVTEEHKSIKRENQLLREEQERAAKRKSLGTGKKTNRTHGTTQRTQGTVTNHTSPRRLHDDARASAGDEYSHEPGDAFSSQIQREGASP